MKRTRTYFLLTILVLLAQVDIVAQCAMCRAVIESDASAEGARVSEGINHGILYLMGFPYLLMFVVAAFLLRSQIKQAFNRS